MKIYVGDDRNNHFYWLCREGELVGAPQLRFGCHLEPCNDEL